MNQNNVKKHGTPKIQFVTSCFNTALAEPCLHDKWLTIDVIVDYINTKYQLRDETNIDKASLIRSLNRYYTNMTTAGNLASLEDGSIVRLYRQQFQVSGTRQQFAYITLKAKTPVFPSAANASSWQADCASKALPRVTRQHVEKVDVLPPPAKRQRTKRAQMTTKQKRQPDAGKLLSMSSVASLDATSLLDRGGGDGALASVQQNESPQCTSTDDQDVEILEQNDIANSSSAQALLTPHNNQPTAQENDITSTTNDPPRVSYWTSTEARKLFRPLPSETTVLDALNNQIKILHSANKTAISYLDLISNLEELNETDITCHQKFVVQQKAAVLALSLHLAKQNMNAWTWERCCEEAVKQLKVAGLTQAKNARTVTEWYRQFREKRSFRIPKPKKNLPPFLHAHPHLCTRIKQYATENLDTLSIEMLSEFIHDKILPTLVKDERRRDDDLDGEIPVDRTTIPNYDEKIKATLRPYGLTCVSPSTVYRWMLCLGFRYEPRRKGYYVDGHERPATVQYRWKFCQRYLAYEQRMHRWIQVPATEANELEKSGEVTEGSGYKYTTDDGLTMVEYHCDTVKNLKPEWITTSLGGNLSVRIPPEQKPLIIFGHDECIFKQFTMVNKQWYGPNRETYVVPKDDGQGVMISAFQSREFGFGLEVTNEDLEAVNATRNGVKYKDEKAAIETKADPAGWKKPLTKSPFVKEFEYGANSDGYWTYQHMVLQLEDCRDIVKVLYPQYDFLFLFDHSCGHDRQREDGLNVENMCKGYGGAQKKLRDTTIQQQDGYLGPHSPKLRQGDVQSMIFNPGDNGPFWMDKLEREAKQHDRLIDGETVTRQFTKAELVQHLKDRGIAAKGKKAAIQAKAQEHGLPLEETKPKCVEGWEGKAKGILQVLWERGWIDEAKLNKYTINGKQDVFGVVDTEFALKTLMANCMDFEEEETLLQSMGREMGISVDRTPKCHCELAGEGIE
jgi:hypothetical protein